VESIPKTTTMVMRVATKTHHCDAPRPPAHEQTFSTEGHGHIWTVKFAIFLGNLPNKLEAFSI